FDKVIVLVVANPNKKPAFSLEERKSLAEKSTRHLENVFVDIHQGLLADYARENKINVIVKGLRAMSDFEYEFQMALTNKSLVPTAETVFLNTGEKYLFTSSSLVRELAEFGGDISGFVPPCVHDEIKKHFAK
ncbi:MAG: pantetheine-phosphate adenylyltransferase, partial [Oscillospiraceae bacterium]